VVTRVEPPAAVAAVIDEGATVEAGWEPPHDAVMTATAIASVMRKAIGLGRYNDIGYSWRTDSTADVSNIPPVATQKVNHELKRCFRFR
jgi:hypothetical protein